MNIISLKNIHKSFVDGIIPQKHAVLNDISFQVQQGKTVAIIGPNGAGKTTTIKIIMGFLFPDSGEVRVFEQPPGSPMALGKIGYVSDHPNFYEYITGREFLHYCGELYGLREGQIDQAIKTYAENLDIAYALDKKLRSYSRGMGQRLNMVQALIHDPDCIILDEPLNGLDPMGRKLFRDVLFELKAKGKTIFMSSHILEDVEALADQIILLKQGRILYDGDLQSLKSEIQGYYQIICRFPETVKPDQSMGENISVRKTGEHIWELDRVPPEQINVVLQWISNQKGEIVSIEKLEPSLEDVFFQKYQSGEHP